MYPHNFNILFRWSAATSSLMRDWLLLQMRSTWCPWSLDVGIDVLLHRCLHCSLLLFERRSHLSTKTYTLKPTQSSGL